MGRIRVELATPDDLPDVRATYEYARAFQHTKTGVSWPAFVESAILAEMAARQLHRVVENDEAIGVFSVVREDPLIWGELERGAHLYLHRIARAPAYGGHGLVAAVLEWASERCRVLGREGLRMDTWADNQALVGYYERHGFALVGRRRLFDSRLPAHYYGVELAMLEKPVVGVVE
jgi:ribosomal protein S18 acetylase RimI-like enzyme